MTPPADWQDCGEAGEGAYGGDYGRGSHRGGGRHRQNTERELQGQTQKPHGQPGEQKTPVVRWVEPGDDRPPRK